MSKACKYGYLEIVKYLLSLDLFDSSKSMNNIPYRPIMFSACKSQNMELIDFLVSLGTIDIKENNNETLNNIYLMKHYYNMQSKLETIVL